METEVVQPRASFCPALSPALCCPSLLTAHRGEGDSDSPSLLLSSSAPVPSIADGLGTQGSMEKKLRES